MKNVLSTKEKNNYLQKRKIYKIDTNDKNTNDTNDKTPTIQMIKNT
jgi:hypothetical protein